MREMLDETYLTLRLQHGPLAGRLCTVERVNGDYNTDYISETTRHDDIRGTRSDKPPHIDGRKADGRPTELDRMLDGACADNAASGDARPNEAARQGNRRYSRRHTQL